MAREIFKALPDTSTPLSPSKLNGVFNGEESMGSIVVEDITCKNLFDKDNIVTNRALNDGNGAVFEATNRNTTDFIKVKPNSDYIFSNISRTAVCLYDENKTFIKTLTTDLITTTSNTYYIRFTYKTDEDYSKGQLELGSVATDYVEHKEFSNKQVYSTNEQVIGTWIDGKPLYRKQITVTDFTANTLKQVEHNIDNLENIIDIRGNVRLNYDNLTTPSKCRKVPLYWLHTNFNITFSIGETTLNFDSKHSTNVNVSVILILEYTKTTD